MLVDKRKGSVGCDYHGSFMTLVWSKHRLELGSIKSVAEGSPQLCDALLNIIIWVDLHCLMDGSND